MPKQQLGNFLKPFMLTEMQIRDTYKILCQDIMKGLHQDTHDNADTKCWISYLQDLPTGREDGKYMALDVGGGAVETSCIVLENNEVLSSDSELFIIPRELKTGSGEKLFDFIASCLDSFAQEYDLTDEYLPLGFGFSFPCRKTNPDKTFLVRWTKGFNCPDVINKDVGVMLKEAIARRTTLKLDLCDVCNNNTSNFMSCNFIYHKCYITVIINNGFNMCYWERSECAQMLEQKYKQKSHVLINTEMGAFGENGSLNFIRTVYDKMLDEKTIDVGQQIFEKMISGLHLGCLVQLLLNAAAQQGLIFTKVLEKNNLIKILKNTQHILTSHVVEIENDNVEQLNYTRHFLNEFLEIENPDEDDCLKVKYICEIILRRSATLTAIGISTLLNKINIQNVYIGTSGYIFAYHNNYINFVTEECRKLVHPSLNFYMVEGHKTIGIGTAISAAVSKKDAFRTAFYKVDKTTYEYLKNLLLTSRQKRKLYYSIEEDISKSLRKSTHNSADIKCRITYVQERPSGREFGEYIGLEFGSLNMRILYISFNNNAETHREEYQLPYTIKEDSHAELFDYIVECLMEFLNTHKLRHIQLRLGFAFSFPMTYLKPNQALLIRWTKDFKCTGKPAENVGRLLYEAIEKRSITNVQLMTVANDTTCILICGAHSSPDCHIGVNIGSSCNVAYMERVSNVELLEREYRVMKHVIITCDWCTFGDRNGALNHILTSYDKKLNGNSYNKGMDSFGKIVEGYYLGSLMRNVLIKAIEENFMFVIVPDKNELLNILEKNDQCISLMIMGKIENDKSTDMNYIRKFLNETFNLNDVLAEDCLKMKFIAAVIAKRAADLIAIGLSVIINKLNMQKVIVAVDGDVFRYHPTFETYMRETMSKYVKTNHEFDFLLTDYGSVYGAALLAHANREGNTKGLYS